MRNWTDLDTCHFLCLVLNYLQIWDIVSFCLLAEIQAKLSKGRDNFSTVFIMLLVWVPSLTVLIKEKYLLSIQIQTFIYSNRKETVVAKSNKKNNKYSVGVCWLVFVCLLSNYCAALYTENLTLLEILVMILQGTASVDLLRNVTVFASKYKLLLCLLSSFFL